MQITHRPARQLMLYLLSSVLMAVSVMAGSLLINEHARASHKPSVIAGSSEIFTPESTVLFTGKQ